MSQKKLHIVLFISLALFWAGSFVAIKEAVQYLSPTYSACFRLFFATMSVGIYLIVNRFEFSLPKKDLIPVWLLGILAIGLPFSLLFWGEQRISAGIAGMINGSVPIWTAGFMLLFAHREDRHDIHFKSIVGLVIGFFGIILVFYPLAQASKDSLLGGLAVVGMALCYALSNVLNKKFLKDIDARRRQSIVFHQHLASFFFLLILAIALEPTPSVSTFIQHPRVLMALIYLGVVSTALALSIYYYLLQNMGSLKTSSIAYLIPAFAIVLDFLFFGTVPAVLSLVGILFVFLGVFYVRTSKSTLSAGSNQINSKSHKRYA